MREQMTSEEYRAWLAAGGHETVATAPRNHYEDDMVAALCRRARLLGWEAYHTYRSEKSEPGFPDVILLKDGVQLVLECKWAENTVTRDQARWLDAFRDVPGAHVYVVRGGNGKRRPGEVTYDEFLAHLDAAP